MRKAGFLMSEDTTITAQGSESRAKPRVAKPGVSKPSGSKPAVSKPKSAKTKSGAPTKAAVKKAAKAVAKVSSKAPNKTKAPARPAKKVSATKPASTKPVSAMSATRDKSVSPASSKGRSLQGAVPAAIAMNTKLVDIAHSNVSAGLELARDLAAAKTPIEAMRLGVAYWFNHMGAVQAQARELQNLSAAWVKTASEQIRTR